MGDLKYLLPILVAVILIWITYLVINFVATIIKTIKMINATGSSAIIILPFIIVDTISLIIYRHLYQIILFLLVLNGRR